MSMWLDGTRWQKSEWPGGAASSGLATGALTCTSEMGRQDGGDEAPDW